jgi:hypothetical protein
MKKLTLGTRGRTIRSTCLNGMIAVSADRKLLRKLTLRLMICSRIGMKILDAVLKKDVVAVLHYQPAKERAEQEMTENGIDGRTLQL